MSYIVAKFGGSSLSDATQFKKVQYILSLDERRKFIVPSAPGKRFADDVKVTDLLLQCFALWQEGQNIDDCFERIATRFLDIERELNLKSNISAELSKVKENIQKGASRMYVESRGEYLNGILLANFLGYTFFDPSNAVYFFDDGKFDSELTNRVLAETLSTMTNAVIPGFYGRKQNGEIQTFSRGGSDITGAIVARALCAQVYENWTDVSGFLMADPSIVKNPQEIKELTYAELRELYYMGANVLHEDAIYPVQRAKIATNIRNTNFPKHPGTFIVPAALRTIKKESITGIAGRSGFDFITIEKAMMHGEIGFAMRVLQAFYEFNIPYEHMPSSIDSLSIVVNHTLFEKHQDAILNRIHELVQPHNISIIHNVALVSVVGKDIVQNSDTMLKLFSALQKHHIHSLCISHPASNIALTIGVQNDECKKAIQAIYTEFMENL